MLFLIFSILFYFASTFEIFNTKVSSTNDKSQGFNGYEHKPFNLSAATFYGDTSDSQAAAVYLRHRINMSTGETILELPAWEISADGFVRIPYVITGNFRDSDKLMIYYAMETIQRGTNILYVPKKDEDIRFINIIRVKNGCRSLVGMSYGIRDHYIKLGDECFCVPIVLHELFHSLGMTHEHQRPDRSGIIEMVGKRNDSNTSFYTESIRYLTPYDLWSISHYEFTNKDDTSPSFARIINRKYNLKPLERGLPFTLSSCDWRALSELYNSSKPAPVCNPSIKPLSYFYPTPSFLRTNTAAAYAYRKCSAYLKIPSMIQCSFNDNEEFADLPWLDEAKYLPSSVVSYAKRLKFCSNAVSRDNKNTSSEKCQEYCIKSCPFTHRNQTLTECIKQHLNCYLR